MEKQTNQDALDRALTDLYRVEIPDGYRAGWRAAVKREEQIPMKQPATRKRSLWRVALPIAAALVLVFGAITAGKLIPTVVTDTLYMAPVPQPGDTNHEESASSYAATGSAAYDNSMAEYEARSSYGMVPPSDDVRMLDMKTGNEFVSGKDSGSLSPTAPTNTAAKIVRTVDLTIATTAFDADSNAITQLALSKGGYIASVSQNGEASDRMDRTAYYSLRIPSDQLDSFLSGLDGIGRITYRNETSTDMTTQYSDTSMRLKTQQDKMARLQELMKQATDVSDLLEIEGEIANTQYEIDTMQSSLLTIDRDVDKSAVSITVQEQSAGDTAKTVELSLWQRLGSGFDASIRALGLLLQNMLVFIVMILPALALIALCALLIVLIVRARRKHRPAHTNEADPSQYSRTPSHDEAAESPHDNPPADNPPPANPQA